MTDDLQPLGDDARALRQRFDDVTTPHREALWRYCRRLTGDPWDAEDLVQDVLLKAFARLSFAWQPTEPRAYLFRMATNAWIDRWRRDRPTHDLDGADRLPASPPLPDPMATRDALQVVVDHLPPRQRVVFLLTEAFGFAHADVAAFLGLTEGAVKALRFRAREALAMRHDDIEVPATGAATNRVLLDRYCTAFNARDVGALLALFDESAVNEIVGIAEEVGVTAMRENSLAEWAAGPPTRALVADACGRTVIVVLETPVGSDRVAEAMAWVVEPLVQENRIHAQRLYCFCPELLAEVGAALGLPVRTRGYSYMAPPD